ncbi:hypothetical protein CLV81_3806 [Flagellimonas meridianipacifica]|uniref:LTXXQ motif family protein n=2 Tax=Flagellimonas meridianipacifica TaxID=1080225 RepID=A0A2T0MD33_9FLAO|nr:hypothetical protein CLV81_3806 [Allomuricauda pacifica]
MISKTLLPAIALLISISAFGQKKMDATKMAEYQTNLMKSELNLDEEQLTKVEEVNVRYSKKTADLMNKEGSMFGKMGDMKKIKKAKNQELERILSEEQMEKFEDELEPQMRKTMRKKMSEE